jgi:hypothetical protein
MVYRSRFAAMLRIHPTIDCGCCHVAGSLCLDMLLVLHCIVPAAKNRSPMEGQHSLTETRWSGAIIPHTFQQHWRCA